ncbi:MAG: cobalamin-dependent protein, partial [Nanoarchaeota archaeon]
MVEDYKKTGINGAEYVPLETPDLDKNQGLNHEVEIKNTLTLLKTSKSKKVMFVTMPDDKCPKDWRAPDYYKTVVDAAKHMPLGILSLATNLRPGHEVKILDARSERLTLEDTINFIEKEKPDVLGLTANSMRAYALKEILQKTSVPYKIVTGGHVKEHPELVLSQGADAVLVGQLVDVEFREAVETMPKGIIKCNKTKFDEIKFPDRTLVDYKTYYPKDFVFFQTKNRLHMISSVGCYQHCTFCYMPDHNMKRKSAPATVDEMQHLYNLGARSVHILDDNFDVSAKWLDNVMDEMDKRDFNVEWSGRGEIRM